MEKIQLDVPITKVEHGIGCRSVRLMFDFSPCDWLIFSKSQIYQDLKEVLGHGESKGEICQLAKVQD